MSLLRLVAVKPSQALWRKIFELSEGRDPLSCWLDLEQASLYRQDMGICRAVFDLRNHLR